ncbi:hypothetical protein PSHT_12532, partial [Puccinia striiformis]
SNPSRHNIPPLLDHAINHRHVRLPRRDGHRSSYRRQLTRHAAFRGALLRPFERPRRATSQQRGQPGGIYHMQGRIRDPRTVSAMTITPCQRSGPNDACTFVRGRTSDPHLLLTSTCRNYTIELEFMSYLDSDNPEVRLGWRSKEGPYAYSGQSFAACKYTNCPIQANVASTYVYHFQTLASNFNYLTFNVTNDFFGPSLFCAGTNVNFQSRA